MCSYLSRLNEMNRPARLSQMNRPATKIPCLFMPCLENFLFGASCLKGLERTATLTYFQRPTTTHNDPQRPTTTHNDPQRRSKTLYDYMEMHLRQRRTITDKDCQRPSMTIWIPSITCTYLSQHGADAPHSKARMCPGGSD